MNTDEEIPQNVRLFLEAVLRGDDIEFPNDMSDGKHIRRGMKALNSLHARLFILDRGDITVLPNDLT